MPKTVDKIFKWKPFPSQTNLFSFRPVYHSKQPKTTSENKPKEIIAYVHKNSLRRIFVVVSFGFNKLKISKMSKRK